jgi:hypothetical protein
MDSDKTRSRGQEPQPIELDCNDCTDNPVGFGSDGYFNTKALCEQNADKDKAWKEAYAMAELFCELRVVCTNDDCPDLTYELPGDKDDYCKCTQVRSGKNRGKWIYTCILDWHGKCCCRPKVSG